jgi:transmembrane sensor
MRKVKVKLSPQILEEASNWFVGFSEGDVDAAGREQFNLWLRTSPEHVRAYLQISAFWEDAALLDKSRKLNDEALIAQALPEDNIFPLVPSRQWPARARAGVISRRFFLAASVIVVLSVAALLAHWETQRSPDYATDVGEQRSIALADGSTIELNSRSRLEIRYSDRERAVELIEGQALFQVAKDPKRPFVVRSGESSVQAIGTQFDVYRKRTGTVVTVLEGRVAVTSSHSPRVSEGEVEATAPVSLSAGEQIMLTPRAAPRPTQANVAAATAWTQRQLIFESTPLADIAEEFNRYNARRIVIAGAGLDRFHVSGVFSSTDPERFVEFLRQRFGVQVSGTDEEIRIVSKK